MHQTPTARRGDPVRRTRTVEQTFETMVAEVREGLSRRPLPELPCKYFYDERGSALFEAITELPEYYQTRTESALLEAHAAAIVGAVTPFELAELGSGAGRKIRLFLDAMRSRGWLESVVLLEISESYLRQSVDRLQADYPEAVVRGIVGDFLHDLPALGPGGGRLLLFLAGTIGNLHPDELPSFFRGAAAALAPGDGFLVGVDLVKDPARLHAAYNDSAGVTAEFNRNILRVLNERLGADFDPDDFEHRAFYDSRAAVDRDAPARATPAHRPRPRGRDRARPRGGRRDPDGAVLQVHARVARPPASPVPASSSSAGSRDPECLFASVLLRRT